MIFVATNSNLRWLKPRLHKQSPLPWTNQKVGNGIAVSLPKNNDGIAFWKDENIAVTAFPFFLLPGSASVVEGPSSFFLLIYYKLSDRPIRFCHSASILADCSSSCSINSVSVV